MPVGERTYRSSVRVYEDIPLSGDKKLSVEVRYDRGGRTYVAEIWPFSIHQSGRKWYIHGDTDEASLLVEEVRCGGPWQSRREAAEVIVNSLSTHGLYREKRKQAFVGHGLYRLVEPWDGLPSGTLLTEQSETFDFLAGVTVAKHVRVLGEKEERVWDRSTQAKEPDKRPMVWQPVYEDEAIDLC